MSTSDHRSPYLALPKRATNPRVTRRRLLGAAGAVGLAAMLVACGQAASTPTAAPASGSASQANSPTPSSAPASQGAAATAAPAAAPKGSAASGNISWLMRSNPFENKWERDTVVAGFQKKYPDVKVDLIVVPYAQVDPKLSTMIAGGSPPDVFSEFGASGFGDYFIRGILKDLTDYYKADKVDMTMFIDGVVDLYSRNGRLYHVPQVTNFGVMTFYNKDLFKEAGIGDLPVDWDDPNWTWDALIEHASKLTKNYGQGVNAQYGVDISQFQNVWMSTYLWGDDPFLPDHYKTGLADKTQLDHPAVIESAQAAADMVYKHKAAPTPADVKTLGAVGDIFATSKIAITFGLPTQAYGNYKNSPFKWGIAPLPKQKTRKVSLFNGCWFVEKDSKQPDVAWTLTSYMLTDEIALEMQKQTGFLVPLKAMVDPWVKQFVSKTDMKEEDIRNVITTSNKLGVENVNHLFVDWPEISTTLTQGLDVLWTGKGTAADAMRDTKAKVDAVVSKTFQKYHK